MLLTDDDEVRITLRLPARLRDRLAFEASGAGRSMNAEILARLEQAYSTWPRIRVPTELQRRIESSHSLEQMTAIEENISRSVVRHLAKQYPEETRMQLIEETFATLISGLPNDDQTKLRSDFDALIESLSEAIEKDMPF